MHNIWPSWSFFAIVYKACSNFFVFFSPFFPHVPSQPYRFVSSLADIAISVRKIARRFSVISSTINSIYQFKWLFALEFKIVLFQFVIMAKSLLDIDVYTYEYLLKDLRVYELCNVADSQKLLAATKEGNLLFGLLTSNLSTAMKGKNASLSIASNLYYSFCVVLADLSTM